MYEYNFFQWLMFFYIYSFVGWCIESTIVSIEKHKLINRGFLRCPMLPIYGFGGLVILFVTLPVQENPLLVYICGMVGTTVLEYFTGWLMETILKMKYWDYSDQKYNLKGRICLQSSLFWGFLSIFLTYGLHDFTEKFVLGISQTSLYILLSVITLIFITDLISSVRTAFDVNKVLATLTEIRSELNNAKEELSKKKNELSAKIEESDTVIALNEKINKLKEERLKVVEKIDFLKKDFIKAHPSAISKHSNEALKELRKRLYNIKN